MTKATNTAVQSYDAYVGKKLRVARKAAGLSQTALGNLVELTFQQIQKYEKGVVRISAGRLVQFARVLKVPIIFFFEGLSPDQGAARAAESKIIDLSDFSDVKSACIKLIAAADDADVRPVHGVLERLTAPDTDESRVVIVQRKEAVS